MLLLCLLMASAAALTAQDWVGYDFAVSSRLDLGFSSRFSC